MNMENKETKIENPLKKYSLEALALLRDRTTVYSVPRHSIPFALKFSKNVNNDEKKNLINKE